MVARVRYLDDTLCARYREANLRFPQVEIGIVPMVGELMLCRQRPTFFADALTLDFSPTQLTSIGRGMDRAHRVRGIPALTPAEVGVASAAGPLGPDDTIEGLRVISPARIAAVWRNIVIYT